MSDLSDSSSMDLENEGDTLGKLFMNEKKVSSKQRIDEIKLFKTRLVDFLSKYFEQMKPDSNSIGHCTSLQKYAIQSNDTSAKALAQKMLSIVSKFFITNKETILKAKFVEKNQTQLESFFEMTFNVLGMKNQNKHTLHSILNLLKIFLNSENASLQNLINNKAQALLTSLFAHKDNSVFKIVMPHLLKSSPSIFEKNSNKFVQFSGSKSQGGAKSDIMRIDNLKILNSMFQRYASKSDESSKEKLPQIVEQVHEGVEALVEKGFADMQGNKRFTKVAIKLLEFFSLYIKALDSIQKAKYKDSLLAKLKANEKLLPADPNVKNMYQKIMGIEKEKKVGKKTENKVVEKVVESE